MFSRTLRQWFPLGAFAAFIAVALKYFRNPYEYIFFALFLIFVVLGIRARSSLRKAVAINVAAIFISLFIAEFLFASNTEWLRHGRKPWDSIWQSKISQHAVAPPPRCNEPVVMTGDWGTDKYSSVFDEVRGYLPKPGSVARITKKMCSETIYDVTYTIDANGLRVTPDGRAKLGKVAFMGCSFTFGEGVNDDENLPWVFGKITQQKYKAYNFGFHGYGPHQMLRVLETPAFSKAIGDTDGVTVVYLGGTFHIGRSAGLAAWDPHGPKYVFDKTGSVTYRGPFNSPDSKPTLADKLHNQLMKSNIADFFLRKRLTVTEADKALFVAIVKKARDIVEKQLNGRFAVVWWNSDDDGAIVEQLKQANIRLFQTKDIFIGHKMDELVIYGDGHPNRLAYNLIARHLATSL